MDKTEERAVWLKHNGFNCCQSVIRALAEEEDLSDERKELLNSAAAGFRTGMGGMEATCGALCGAVMMAGLHSENTLTAGKTAKRMHEMFIELSGASICKMLKSRQPDGSLVCECDDCVRHGVRVFHTVH